MATIWPEAVGQGNDGIRKAAQFRGVAWVEQPGRRGRAPAQTGDLICSQRQGSAVTQQFVLGREGAALEEEIAQLCGVAHGIAVASGTDALILALRACGVQAGDEVLIPPFTFVATGSAVSALGAKPIFADIHPNTYNTQSRRSGAPRHAAHARYHCRPSLRTRRRHGRDRVFCPRAQNSRH